MADPQQGNSKLSKHAEAEGAMLHQMNKRNAKTAVRLPPGPVGISHRECKDAVDSG